MASPTRGETAEEVLILEHAVDPPEEGMIRYKDGSFRLKDAVGVYDPRNVADSEKVKVSSNDTTADYLSEKITGDGVTISQVNDGGNEDLKFTVTANSAYIWDLNPALLMTSGCSSKVLANGYAAIEVNQNSTDFGVWSGSCKRTPVSDVTFKIRFFMKASGTGGYVRIALKIKSRAVGEDTSTGFDYSSFVAVPITYTTVGKIFEGTFTVSASVFANGDSTTVHAGRDGHNDMGGGQLDNASKAIQIISIYVDIP